MSRSTLLICDDEDLVRELVVSALGDRYRVFEASDGGEALEQARLVRPDLILLDMMMPEKSGLDVLAELRCDPELAGTPVIMLTGRTQAFDREAISTAGADMYLSKPFSLAELEITIETLLGWTDATG